MSQKVGAGQRGVGPRSFGSLSLSTTKKEEAANGPALFSVQLIQAVSEDNPDPQKITSLLSSNADPNAKDENGNTALMIAVQYTKLKASFTLINSGADVSTDVESIALKKYEEAQMSNPFTADSSEERIIYTLISSANTILLSVYLEQRPVFDAVQVKVVQLFSTPIASLITEYVVELTNNSLPKTIQYINAKFGKYFATQYSEKNINDLSDEVTPFAKGKIR